jgi:hypothetical protein
VPGVLEVFALRAKNIALYSLGMLGALAAVISLGEIWLAARRAPRFSLNIPPAPEQPTSRHGLSIYIIGPKKILSGHAMHLKVGEINHRSHTVLTGAFPPAWALFPGTWCWGPDTMKPTALTRFVKGGQRSYGGGSMILLRIKPGGRHWIAAMNLSHSFDLSAPGRYEAQLSGRGMVSNVITFRVLAPDNNPGIPALKLFASKPGVQVSWGSPWHHIEIGIYGRLDPRQDRTFSMVHVLIRNIGNQSRTIKLTGCPECDFIHRRVIGLFGEGHPGPFALGYLLPFDRESADTYFTPAPRTAYGKRMAMRRRHPPPELTYTISPGTTYIYRKPLAISRDFDLSVYGTYHFSTQLRGTPLRTARLQ